MRKWLEGGTTADPDFDEQKYMKTSFLKVWIVGALLGWSTYSFSQLGPTESPLASGPEPIAASPSAEGYFVVNGIAYYTRQGQAYRVERDVTLRVTPTGIVGFDGKPLILARGLMLSTDGRHAPIPSGINIENLPGRGGPVQGDPTEAARSSSENL